MFVVSSLLVALLVLASLFYCSKERQTSLKRKFKLLVILRQLLALSRAHRDATHQSLFHRQTESSQVSEIQTQIRSLCQQLITTAQFENRPMYRILELKLKGLESRWQERNVARNQIIHGKAIRHCLFLMDELALAWLIESGREDLSYEYHINWQQVLDAMETLTQLRISIQDVNDPQGLLRTQYNCQRMRTKLNQLAVVCPLTMASPSGNRTMNALSEVIDHSSLPLSQEALYQLTTDISLSIAQVYDQMLNALTDSLYQPLPKLAIKES